MIHKSYEILIKGVTDIFNKYFIRGVDGKATKDRNKYIRVNISTAI